MIVYSALEKIKNENESGCGYLDEGKCRYQKDIDHIKKTAGLQSKTVLLVGGRRALRSYCRGIVEKNGGVFEHHDGGMEKSKKQLPGLASRADIVICALDCISHLACQSMKKICKKENKSIVYLKNTGFKNLDERIREIC